MEEGKDCCWWHTTGVFRLEALYHIETTTVLRSEKELYHAGNFWASKPLANHLVGQSLWGWRNGVWVWVGSWYHREWYTLTTGPPPVPVSIAQSAHGQPLISVLDDNERHFRNNSPNVKLVSVAFGTNSINKPNQNTQNTTVVDQPFAEQT